jgi:hypothetical protein
MSKLITTDTTRSLSIQLFKSWKLELEKIKAGKR